MLLGGLWLAFHVFSLTAYPPPTCDETTYGGNADSFLRFGTFGQTNLPAGDPVGRDVNYIHFGRLYAAALALVYALAGVTLPAARALSLVGWSVAALLTYLLGCRLYDRRVAFAGALLFAVSPKALLAAHLARADGWAAAALALVLWMLAGWLRRPRGAQTALALGLVSVMPMEIHANGVYFLLAASLIVVIEVGLRQKRRGRVALFGLGMVLGLCLWATFHLWPDPALAWRQATSAFFVSQKAPWTRSPDTLVLGMVNWLQESFWIFAGPLGKIESVTILLGVALALRRRTPGDALLLTWLMAPILPFAVLATQKSVQYAILWMPGFSLLAAAGLRDLAALSPGRWFEQRSGSAAWRVVVLGLVALYSAGDFILVQRYRDSGYETEAARLAALVPPGQRVLADAVWWWTFRDDHVFLDDSALHTYLVVERGRDDPDIPAAELSAFVARFFQRVRPDYVLLDDAIGCFLSDSITPALAAYVAANCNLVGEVAGAWVGDPAMRYSQFGQWTRVYHCPSGAWPKGSELWATVSWGSRLLEMQALSQA